jgi:hypothetical protein
MIMGFDLGGIFKSFVNPATLLQLAAGPAGWASIATQTLLSSVGSQVIQQLGQQMGLPQSMISLAQSAFSQNFGGVGSALNLGQAVSGLAQQFNLSPTEQGNLQRTSQDFADNLTSMFMDRLKGGGSDEDSQSFKAGGKAGGSLLMKIAIALGKLLDKKMTEMANLTDQIGKLGSGKDNQSKLGELTGKLQGLSQEVSMLSNALTNTIKTIGESNSTIARKG